MKTIAEVLMIKLTEGEKAEKQKAKGMILEKIWFWKVECETKKERSWKGGSERSQAHGIIAGVLTIEKDMGSSFCHLLVITLIEFHDCSMLL